MLEGGSIFRLASFPLRVLHSVWWLHSSFLVIAEQYFLVWMYYGLLICFPITWLVAVMKKVVKDICYSTCLPHGLQMSRLCKTLS